MESGINLLPEITEKEIKAGVYQKKVNIAAIGALFAVGIIILGLISYKVFLKVSADTVENKSHQAEERISKNSAIEITHLSLKEKLDKTQSILESEMPASILIDEVTKASLTSQPITLQGLSAQADGTVLVDGTAINSTIFKEWIDNLTNDNAADFFSKIKIVSLTGDPSGYKFSFSLSFLKKGVYQQK